MELQLFIYKNIALHFYYSKESLNNQKISVKNILLYFPGLPQIIDKEFFTNKVNKGTAFVSVYYLGSLLSGGSFTYRNCQETVRLAIEFIKNGHGTKTFDNQETYWKYKNLHILGYSFSGNPILSTKISKEDVKNVILFAPLIFLNKKEVAKYLEDKKIINNFFSFSLFYLEFLKRGFKFAFRGIERKSWHQYFAGDNQKSLININDNYPAITIFHGKADKKISYSSSLFFQKEKCPTTKVFLINNAGHDLEKIFNIKKIIKIIN